MKKILAAIFLTLSLGASAESVFLYPTCYSTGMSGECTLQNNSGKDVSCSIQVYGSTKSGRSISAFEYRTLYSGMMAWVTVGGGNPNDPIIFIQGNASCNTLR